MTVQPVQLLDAYGPDRCETLTVEQATRWCRRLALGRYENFSVLSALVPRGRRDDFAAVYAFCRWADDLGDEVGDRARSLELLGWWREELRRCLDGVPRHPVFVALAPVVARAGLAIEPFDELIRAFEQDQTVTRYETWDEVIGYCRRSANPVGRLVLGVLGQEMTPEVCRGSDAICTALQLTNHWQDIGRDAVERDRIYVPRELVRIDRFEERLVASARQGFAVDRTFLGETRALVKDLVARTWAVWAEGDAIWLPLRRDARPLVWLFAAGGRRVLRLVEEWNYETVLHRPALGPAEKLALVASALVRKRLGWFDRLDRRAAEEAA